KECRKILPRLVRRSPLPNGPSPVLVENLRSAPLGRLVWNCSKPACRAPGRTSRLGPILPPSQPGDYFLTLTWNPAPLRAWISSAASKSPTTSKVASLALAVSPVTPLTFLTVSLMALVQDRQQLWIPVRVRLVTLPLGAPLSSLMVSSAWPV